MGLDRLAPGRPSKLAPHAGLATDDDTELVERVVLKLNTICKAATFDFAMSVGKVIIETFYSQDVGAWRARGPKIASFRKLARHPELPMSPSALYRCVAIYELCQRIGADRWHHISTTHIRVVLPLPPAEQSAMLLLAETNRWPVRRLRDEIAERHGITTREAASPPRSEPRLRATMQTLRKCIDESCNLVGANDRDLEASPDTVRSMMEIVQRIQKACANLENRLRGASSSNATCDQT